MRADGDFGDASRRTWLAAERTWLAWLRTGLALEGLALAVGKLLPTVAHGGPKWPYTAIGAAYAVLGAVLLAYALARRRLVERALERGAYVHADDLVLAGALGAGVLLGVATALLVVAT